MFDMPGNQINQNKRATKRKLSLPATQLQGINTEIKPDSDDDVDERYQRYVEQFEKDTKPGNKKKQGNSEWNETNMVLIRHLGKREPVTVSEHNISYCGQIVLLKGDSQDLMKNRTGQITWNESM